MRHVVFYGPPAAGKLAAAQAFAGRYGMKLVDNHLTSDPAARLFDRGTEAFYDLVVRLRLAMFEAAAVARQSLVSTTAFVEADRPFIIRVIEDAARLGVNLSFVQLCPPPSVLEARVTTPSRAARVKLKGAEALRHYLSTTDGYRMINETDLAIDYSELTPDEVAILVGRHLML